MQHDGNIANQLFPATRADMNLLYESLLSNSLGAAAPAVTFAGQWFYNETDDILYIRDKDNAIWVALGTITDGEFTPYLGGDVLEQGTDAILGLWEAATGAEAAALASNALVVTPLALASVLATELLLGLARYATIAEVQTGTATDRAAHPDGIASLWQQGAAIASAATLVKPADASLGRHYSLTGNVTVAALWAGEVQGREVVLTCASTPTFTHSANLDLPGAANFTAAAGDVLTFKAGASPAWKCTNISKYNGKAVVETNPAVVTSKLAQVASYSNNAYTTCGTIVPSDDTVPTSAEGTQILELAFTPTNAGSTLEIEWNATFGGSSGRILTALFQDGGSALAIAGELTTNTSQMITVPGKHMVAAGSTAARTYTVRAGNDTATDIFLNGDSVGRIFGGASKAWLIIKEYLP